MGGRGSQGAPSEFLLSLQFGRQLAWHKQGALGPCPHLCIWLDSMQAEAQLLGEGGSGHVPDYSGHKNLGDWREGRLVLQRVWNPVENPTVPKSLLFPLPTPPLSPQGNNIMLVASQPAPQGPERKRYEIVFREVRGTRPPCFQPTPPPLPWSLALMPVTLLPTSVFSPRSPLPAPGRQELGDGVGGCRSCAQSPTPLTYTCGHPPTQEFWSRPDGQPATREHLLMALADLDEILVRATFSSMPVAASISSVSLEVARPGPSQGPRALEVEECRCPPGYVGLSCQVSTSSPTPALAQPFDAEGSPLEKGVGGVGVLP